MNKKLASQFASAMAVAMLFGTSAFAETRHHDETNRSGETHERHQRDGNHDRSQFHNQQQQPQPQQSGATVQPERSRGEFRNYDRSQTQTRTYNNNNNNNRNNNNRWNDGNRNNNNNRWNDSNRYNNNNRNYSNNNQWRGNDHRGSSRDYGRSGSAYHAHGRISRIERWNGGYRVFVGGALYPFFIPEARFRIGNWRVGVDIGLGGYYNPLGYYDYYDDGYYSGGYSGGYTGAPVYSSGELRGVVETVDYRRGTFVLRDDASNSFVTVLMRGRFESIRPGDYVSVAGDWSRNGIFEAYRADLIDNGYYQQ